MRKSTVMLLIFLCSIKHVICHALNPDNLGILGGHVVPISKVPYMVSLRYKGSHYCGASIIHERWLVSAAHCMNFEANKYKIRVGTDQINDGGDLYDIENIIVHKKYAFLTKDYDISLIKLTKNITFGPNVSQITLADKSVQLKTGAMLQVIGWGKTNMYGDTNSKDLLEVDVPVKSKRKCSLIFKKYGIKITPRMICAGAKAKDTCQGDSGGPITMGDKQVGVTSFGKGCGEYPGVYAKISSLLPWIKKNMKLNF